MKTTLSLSFLFTTVIILSLLFYGMAGAQEASVVESSKILSGAETLLEDMVAGMASVLFYPVFGFPFLVLWLILGGVFFTLRMGFVNVRMFSHAFKVMLGKFDEPDAKGQITPFAALSAAVSGTVGLGNIAGVAVAVTIGGPGAVIWMMVAGVLGMSTKFVEATLGHKYRQIDENGKVSGGAFYYLRDGLKEKGLPRLGRVLAVMFAVLCLGGAFGGGNMFQANQTVAAMSSTFDILNDLDWGIALVMAVSVGIVLIGGVKRIAMVAEAIVPSMAFIYLFAGCVVLITNYEAVPGAIAFMVQDAFTASAGAGGIMGAIITGFRRSAFSNEAGVGSGPIVMSAMKTDEPVRAGCLGVLEPFIDTLVICFMTGLIITVTGVYETGDKNGVMLTSAAFATVISWFPSVLSVCVALFAFSTMITWSYYGEKAWNYLFGNNKIGIYHVIFCTATFFGGIINLGVVIDFSDLLLLSMAFPNLIGLYILSGVVKKELKSYLTRYKNGEFREL